MFFCNTCFTETPQPPRSQRSEISLISDDREHNINNSIMIKTSLYTKYLQKCKGGLFTDPEFPPDEKSLGFKPEGRKVGWKRISEIVPDCLLFEGGIEETDVQTGNLGDVYFLPTVAALARHPNRIRTIFHLHNSIEKQGIYCLLVKSGGIVRELVIDDYVPVYSDSGRPAFCKSNGREVWVMLLEKAWAKLKGSYGSMLIGCPHEVLNAFCIGPCLSYDLTHKSQELKVKLWNDMREAYINRRIICATSSLIPQMSGLPGRRIFSVLGLSELKGTQQIKLHNYWSEEMPSLSIMTKHESPGLGSIIYSPTGRTASTTTVKARNEELILSLNEFMVNFDRLDISHDNGKFNYEFKEIVDAPFPIFIEFEVPEDHQAYICITKTEPNDPNGKPESLRLLMASSSEEEGYKLETANCDTQFSDCFVHMEKFSIGRHVLMINGTFSKQKEQKLILGYSWRGLSKGSKTDITQMPPNKPSYQQFINSIFLNHCSRAQQHNVLSSGTDMVRCVSLFNQCGYGYVACRVAAHSKFRLDVAIDESRIEASGLRMVGQWGSREIVRPGEEQIFVFQLASEELETHFPPDGFSVSKII